MSTEPDNVADAEKGKDSSGEKLVDELFMEDNLLSDVYWYVIRDRQVTPDTLCLGHLIQSLEVEGILFWRDARFRQSQDVALGMAKKKRGQFSSKILQRDQVATAKVLVGFQEFVDVVSPCANLFLEAFSEELVIQDWATFTSHMTHIFYEVEPNRDGENADYIPILKDADSEKWGLSICSTDGQRFSLGDVDVKYTLQSTSKPITAALGLKQEGIAYVDEWIGVEPAGRPFNTQDLDPDTNRPFNSSVNSGAIMSAGIYASNFPDSTWREVVDRVRETWYDMCGNDLDVGFSEETFESEKSTAYNNFAIAYNLKGRKGLPRDVDLLKMLDVYLGCCSIEITAEAMAVAAATLANGGICPITSKEVFPCHVVRHVLSETMTCGMYDQSGLFAVEVGLPAKSGVSGALMVMVPNVFGFATFSPRLNARGNSVRGVEFCKSLVSRYRVHTFEPLRSGTQGAKIDPRKNGWKNEELNMSRESWALKVGDARAVRLRDIFLFSLIRVANSSSCGLSDKALALIRKWYCRVYSAEVEESHLQEVIDSVKRHPTSLKFLEELVGDFAIPDETRSLILLAMVDVLTLEGNLEENEIRVTTKVCVLLGVDEEVAEMRLMNISKHVGHRFKFASPLQPAMRSVSHDSALTQQSLRGLQQTRTASLKEATEKDVKDSVLFQENLHLRREVQHLKQQVASLTTLLHSREKRSGN